MARRSYGYGAYRGRGGGSLMLKIVVAVLLVVLLLSVAAFLYLPRYLVYEDDGSVRLELPFLTTQETPSPAQTPLVVTPSPTPAPEKPETILPLALPAEALWDGTAAELVAEGGGNAALFDMKLDSGELLWVSEENLAIEYKATAGEPGRNTAILSGRGDGVYRIARVSCFRDTALGSEESYAILTNSGYRWKDAAGFRWSSPTNAQVRSYLVALCVELSELGFDEILLDYAGYPTQGTLSYIKKGAAYDSEQFEAVISGFYEEVATALKDSGTALSVVFEAESCALSGQSAQTLNELSIAAVTREPDGAFRWPAGGQKNR